MPGWRCFHRQFLPHCPPKILKNHFDHFHNVAHPGRLASHHVFSSRFVWRGLSSDVTAWARGCLACQRGKIHCHTHLVPQPIPIPQRHFSHLHVDLVGPLQYSNNFNYVFTFIDHTFKWMEANPLSETSVAAYTKAFYFYCISHFRVPETTTSDRGPQFTSNLWFQLCEMLNISHKQTTANHPKLKSVVDSSDSERSQGKTLVFPWLRQFSVPKLSCQMNFGKMMNFQLMLLSKIFQKAFMFLLLLCLGTIPAPTCPASCQLSCSRPPSFGPIGAASFHPFSRSTTAPTWFCATAPAPSLSGLGCGTRSSPVNRLKACTAVDATPGSPPRHGRPPGLRPGGLAATKRVSFSDPLISSPSSSQAPPQNGPRTVFLPGEEVFACLGPAAPSQPPQTWYPSRQWAPPKRLDL
jgi:hypothetical protein